MNTTVQAQLLSLRNHVLIKEPERLTLKEAGDKNQADERIQEKLTTKSTRNKSRNTRIHEEVINTWDTGEQDKQGEKDKYRKCNTNEEETYKIKQEMTLTINLTSAEQPRINQSRQNNSSPV